MSYTCYCKDGLICHKEKTLYILQMEETSEGKGSIYIDPLYNERHSLQE